tara:strand:- start:13068 stop:13748 length:681 start_codon:yes stop_codon:yes gene_type:complete
MAQGGTIAQRITDLIGATYNTEAAYEGDLINAAINEIADMLPDDVLLKYSAVGVQQVAADVANGYNIEDKKVLKVMRRDSSVDRECAPLSFTQYQKAADSTSIYQATNFSPVYTIDYNNNTPILRIRPNCTDSNKGFIYCFSYASGDNEGKTQATINSDLNLPTNIIHAIALKSSVNILKAYISNQVQDEEDIELMQMISTQMQLLEKDFMTEMQRYLSQVKPEGE